ncbi:hypothetical protein N8649_00105 [bacterium]|nr:hypothetical protein [bacterium]MDB4446402.1 hypothetical protein [Akkermansiaceae bacterium]
MKFIYSATLAGALIAAAGVVIFQKFGSEQNSISERGLSSGSSYGQKPRSSATRSTESSRQQATNDRVGSSEIETLLVDRFPLSMGSNTPSHELRERLNLLRAESTERLNRLSHQLSLTPDQQQKAYPLLLRSSPFFGANILIDGQTFPPVTANMVNEELLNTLDSVQQNDMIEDLVDEREWWSELVADFEAELEEDQALAEGLPLQPTEMQDEEQQSAFNLFNNAEE